MEKQKKTEKNLNQKGCSKNFFNEENGKTQRKKTETERS